MDHGTVFKIGTFFCRIEQDFSSDFFNLWSNRVEPYLVESIESENMITISYRKKIFPEKRTFLKSESSGFFASYITKVQAFLQVILRKIVMIQSTFNTYGSQIRKHMLHFLQKEIIEKFVC